MMDSTDMSTPVTRGELQDTLGLFQQEARMELQVVVAPLATRAELQSAVAPLATKAELQSAVAPLATKAELHQAIETAVAPLATKAELEMWGGALVARIQHGEQLIQQTQQQIQQSEQRLLAELARHTAAIQEATRAQIKASTEPFDDLPRRVSWLETEVFGPAPGKSRPRRRRS